MDVCSKDFIAGAHLQKAKTMYWFRTFVFGNSHPPPPPPPSPFFQLCCLIAEKGKGIVLWKGPVNNLLKDNYRGYDDLFVSLTFFFFRYPIIMWKNFASKRPSNIGALVISKKKI